jgi:L-arabinonolactonase
LVANVHCQLAACVLYDDVNDAILWTDILGQRFHQFPLSGGGNSNVVTRDLPAMLCAFALRPPDLPGHLCAWEDGFQLYDLDTGVALSEKSLGEEVCPAKLPSRLNDGRVDAQGKRFICGGFYGDVAGNKIKVFKCEYNRDGKELCHEPILDDIEVTNSICFAPPENGNTMFFADSPTKKICAYEYDVVTGNVSGKRLLHTVTEGVPDGSICDSEGFLWNAVWRNGAGPSMVNRIDPSTGEVVFTVKMPDSTSQVSCCCLGGKDLDLLFITTASVATDIANEPHAGAIYAAKVGVKGMKEDRFIGK